MTSTLCTATAALISAGCGSGSSPQMAGTGLADLLLPVRATPIAIPIYPLANSSLSAKVIHEVAIATQPPVVNHAYPPSVVYHGLRLWGRTAAFPHRHFGNSAVRGKWGETMFDILTRDDIFSAFSAPYKVDHLLIPSPYGVMVQTSADAGWGGHFTSTHPGKYLQVMGDLGISSDFPIRVFDEKPHTIADVVRDEAVRLSLQVEQEWLACGLSRYLDVVEWRNRFHEWMTFDKIANHLLSLQYGQGSCAGVHIPYALATLVAVHSQRSILATSMLSRVEDWLRRYSRHVTQRQRDDGGWDNKWAETTTATEAFLSGTYDNSGIIDNLSVTGHQLEWMTICRPDLRPDDSVLDAAALNLSRMIPLVASGVEANWHTYFPLTHAAKALLATADIPFMNESFLVNY